MEEKLKKLEENIAYDFKDKGLLIEALTHRSYSNENSKFKKINNERLEFLGDAVLELTISQKIYKLYKNKDEGFMTKKRAKLVCEKSFSFLADQISLADFILLGKGEDITGGRKKESIKADCFEALCGAMFLDGGFDQVIAFIEPKFKLIEDNIKSDEKDFADYKTLLQEYMHKKKKYEFKYILSKESGPAHERVFYIDVYLNSKVVGNGRGRNKKEAEQNAARDALIKLGEVHE